jgi:hypothetical protein
MKAPERWAATAIARAGRGVGGKAVEPDEILYARIS